MFDSFDTAYTCPVYCLYMTCTVQWAHDPAAPPPVFWTSLLVYSVCAYHDIIVEDHCIRIIKALIPKTVLLYTFKTRDIISSKWASE